jgi:serine/threonine-protein kinase RsbW
MLETKVFPAVREKLPEILEIIRTKAQSLGFDETMIFKIELASEEALVNVMSHAYPNGQGNLELDCTPVSDKGMRIVLKDQGIPFNPLKDAKEVNKDLPLEDRKVGGYGIFIIKQTMDEVLYSREKDTNILTMIKYKKDIKK